MASEELRALLRQTDFESQGTPARGGAEGARGGTTNGIGQTPLKDLASLLGTLDIDIGTPWAKNRHGNQDLGGTRYQPEGSGPTPAPVDQLDASVLYFGNPCSLRGRLGRYVNAIPQAAASSAGSAGGINYAIGVDGQGVGDPLDCLVLLNTESREDQGPIRYGQTVSLRAPAAKDRMLGTRDGNKLGFWRSLMGHGEKWVVFKALAPGGRAAEEPNSRGTFVRQGDFVLLCTGSVSTIASGAAGQAHSSALPGGTPGSELLLSVNEGLGGCEARLTSWDRSAGLGAELWQIDLHGAQPLPAWSDRPYLSGKFLLSPPEKRRGGAELYARAFPSSSSSSSSLSSSSSTSSRTGSTFLQPPPVPGLSELSAAQQQAVLVREVLLALTGVEGCYVRLVAAGSGSGSGPDAGHPSTPSLHLRLQDVKLSVDQAASSPGERATTAQVSTLLPLCEHAITVREFSRLHSRLSHGLVSHALAAAVKTVMREFDLLVAQLEHQLLLGKLSLQRCIFLLQPSKATLRLLASLARRLWDKGGGELLDCLHAFALEQGDARAKSLCQDLLRQASQPFLRMLARWLFRGELEDPYNEFMICEDSTLTPDALSEDFNAQYWELRHTLRETHIPRMFRGIAARALTAGKYLNVVRGCIEAGLGGGLAAEIKLPPVPDLAFDGVGTGAAETDMGFTGGLGGATVEAGAAGLNALVEQAYAFSSRALLRLLCEGHGLFSHLRSLQRFFLLEHGDFFIQFMDAAEDELRRDAKDVAVSRVQGLLQLALQTSTLSQDPHREDLSCSLASHNLIQHLHLIQSAGGGGASAGAGAGAGGSSSGGLVGSGSSSASSSTVDASGTGNQLEREAALAALSSQGLKGVEALTLDYSVGWPVSLLLSRRAITKYQLLSRLLYFSKHVELRVLGAWQGHQLTKQLNVRGAMGAAYCLRHRMLHFLHNFVYYMTLEVVGPRAHEMFQGMQRAGDMDEVLELHERFLDTCLKECLLASQNLLKNLTKIMTTCLLFADQMRRFSESSVLVGESASVGAGGAGGGGASERERARENTRERRELGELDIDQQIAGTGKGGGGGASGKGGAGGSKAAPAGKTGSGTGAGGGGVSIAAQRKARLASKTAYVCGEAAHESFQRMLAKFAETFDSQLKEFLERLWADSYRHHPQLANLCTRLDYNQFYSITFSA